MRAEIGPSDFLDAAADVRRTSAGRPRREKPRQTSHFVASRWCNVKGAGLGERPRAAPSPLIDAYLYVKVPGESDGTSHPNAPRFDPASDDATPVPPQAGKMFDAYLIDLLKNANPPLGQ